MQRLQQLLAVRVVPRGVEALDELNDAADFAPRRVVQVGAHVADLLLHRDLVLEVIEAEDR
jgi:hypothetical protein